MLTRLQVRGFKNLVDVDVRFGPFTCIAGPNGAGKSNLFDAISFLSALADRTLVDAALSVRSEGERTGDIRSLFNRRESSYATEMSFCAEMIIPREGEDDLGKRAEATTTFLRYAVKLAYRENGSRGPLGDLEILREELTHLLRGRAAKHLLFRHNASTWRSSVLSGKRTSPFISTEGKGRTRTVKLHQDKGPGRPRSYNAVSLPKTVLSETNAAESPTALLAKREMQSWKHLQLEPSALRKPDEFSAPATLGPNGSHLPATLYRLAREELGTSVVSRAQARIYAQVANRLAELIDDVHQVWVDRDERRELLTLTVAGRDGTCHAARALSDGTLRFLALAVLMHDHSSQGVLCLEEPENGIHPTRIPAMIDLLRDIATDVEDKVGADNPLRQVVVNTHSPAVVQQVPDDSLLLANMQELMQEGQRLQGASFRPLPGNWRSSHADGRATEVCQKGDLLAYLNPVTTFWQGRLSSKRGGRQKRRRAQRLIDREDIQLLLLPDRRDR